MKFGILHLFHIKMLVESFYKDRTKTLCTGAHKRIRIHYGLWTEFRSLGRLGNFRLFKLR